MQNVLSISDHLNGLASWKRKDNLTIHCYYPQSSKASDTMEVDYGYGGIDGVVYHKNINCAGTIKLALNQFGIWINGKLIKGDSVNSIDVPTDDTDVFNKLFNQIKQHNTLMVGSYEGSGRSFQHYNEISVLHKLYSANEMVILTSVN